MRIATWNANGVLNKKFELEAFLKTKNIDICLLSETHLKNDLDMVGYRCYKASHPSGHSRGGSAILVKSTIKHNEEFKIEAEEVQLIMIKITSTKQDFNVGSVYCPPRYNIKKNIFKDLLSASGSRFLLGGDYNAKHIDWGSRMTSTRGRELRKAIQEVGCCYHSTETPTYWPTDANKIPDLIDFFISKRISSNFLNLEDNFDLDSDHSAVILNLSEKVIKKQSKPTLVNRTTDWVSFKHDIIRNVNLNAELQTEDQLDSEVEGFIKLIQETAWKYTRFSEYKPVSNNYPKEITDLIAQKRRARRKWQESRHPDDKTTVNRLSQTLKRKIKNFKSLAYENYIKNLSATKETDYSLWKATKNTNRPIKRIPPLKKTDGTWAKDNKDKAELFADHLEKIFQPNEINSNSCLVEDYIVDDSTIALFTQKEIYQEIKSLKSNKAPGFDLITAEIVKELPRKALTFLKKLMNAAVNLRYVPNAWKVAEVIMIEKPGKPINEAKSYRPISLLPMISKLFEKLLLRRLMPIIDNKKLIPNHQFGFRTKHATIDQVHRMTNIIEKALEEKQICSTIFLDVAQAFDKVWHEGLIFKLKRLIPLQFVEILESYLSDRLFRIKQDEEYSTLREIKAGVPQGSILGPILYLLYTSDLPEIENVTVATFADDTAILAVGPSVKESTKKLQEASNNISKWTNKWKIKLNESKSVHVNFTNKNLVDPPQINLNGARVSIQNTAKYLGMTLDVKLRWKEHVKKKKIELENKYRENYWLLGRGSKLTTYNKVLIYNQIIKPIWTYGIQLWGCAKQTHIKQIQTFQNKVLRNIVGAPWYVRNSDIHRDLGIPSVYEEIRSCAMRHRARLEQHINIEASRLIEDRVRTERLKRTRPLDLA